MVTEQPNLDVFNKDKILNIEYMSGLDIEFADADSKDAFVRDTFVIKHYDDGTKSIKTPTKDLEVLVPKNHPRFLTIRCPVSEQDVSAIVVVDNDGDIVVYYDWKKKN